MKYDSSVSLWKHFCVGSWPWGDRFRSPTSKISLLFWLCLGRQSRKPWPCLLLFCFSLGLRVVLSEQKTCCSCSSERFMFVLSVPPMHLMSGKQAQVVGVSRHGAVKIAWPIETARQGFRCLFSHVLAVGSGEFIYWIVMDLCFLICKMEMVTTRAVIILRWCL